MKCGQVNALKIELTANEARILGCLMEKSVVTPDQYPLTLNSLTLACNQKSSRDPVMSLDQGTVQHTARQLENKHLLSSDESFKGRVVKYTQRLCNTPFGEFQFSEAEFAVMCLLLLRGAQTPGELRARSGRLHKFEDNAEVTATLQGLIDHAGGAVVARLGAHAGAARFAVHASLFGRARIGAGGCRARGFGRAGAPRRSRRRCSNRASRCSNRSSSK